jgi:hypothetical protein
MMNDDDDMPMRLKDVLRLEFPNGGMTVSGLRREAAKGRLIIERIANKDFTTRNAIKKMRELCKVQATHKEAHALTREEYKRASLAALQQTLNHLKTLPNKK